MLDQTTLPKARREPDVLVWLPGPPRGKAAPKAMVLKANPDKGRFEDRAMMFQDSATRSYEAEVKHAGVQAMAGRAPYRDCMMRCRVTAVFPIPKSGTIKWHQDALVGIVRPIVKPDDDNLLKIRDSLKGIVFHDDCLFVESMVRKFYGTHPGWQFEAWVMTPEMLL